MVTFISLLANAQVFNNELFGFSEINFHNNKNSIELLIFSHDF